MNEEKAQQLKDAGFPQDKGLLYAEEEKERYGWFQCCGKGDAYIDGELIEGVGAFRDELRNSYKPYKEAIYIPTLSELIDACGDGFSKLERITDQNWLAESKKIDWFIYSKTPEEAVTNLILALVKAGYVFVGGKLELKK